MSKKTCPFCDLSKLEIIYKDDYCFGMIISEPLKKATAAELNKMGDFFRKLK